MGLNPVPVQKRPARLSSAIGVAAAAVALAAVVARSGAHLVIVLVVAGLAVGAIGVAISGRGYTGAGRTVLLAGVGLALLAIPIALTTVTATSVQLALLPGVLGLLVLGLALLPIRGQGSRGWVKTGTALVFVGVIAGALFRISPADRLVVSVGLVVVAWDVSDHAIGIGEQLGGVARTRRLELVHVGGSGAVASVGVLAASLVGGVSIAGLGIEAFVLLLVAVVTLSLSLHG